MADVDGKWAIEVATLAGSRRYDLTLTTTGNAVTGTAVGAAGPLPLRNGVAVADTVEFVLDLLSPVPRSLTFTLRVTGNRMVGTAQSGVLPAASVVGTRT